MILKEIYENLNKIAPFEYQEEWDNSGLLIGDMNAEVNRILVTLDVTDEVVEQAIAANANTRAIMMEIAFFMNQIPLFYLIPC